MKPLYEEESWHVSISWKKPMLYDSLVENGSAHDETANLYMILGRYSSNSAKILYIGKTVDQWVSKRLGQQDHKNRYAAFIGNYPRHWFQVSLGVITMHNGNKTAKRIGDIEQLLIFVHDSEHRRNVKNVYNHGVTGSYRIENTGFKCTLPKCLMLGIFVG